MKHTRRTGLVALGATLALTLTACGGGEKEGSSSGTSGGGGEASGETIKIGVIADMTGATADVGGPYNRGMLAYVDSVNTAGGLGGSKIEAISNDYAYEVPKAEQLYKQYVNDEVVAIQGWGTGDSEALHGKVAQDELPFMSASYAEALTDPKEAPYNFVVAATYSDQIRVALNWINKDSGGDAEVAVFHHDSPFGNAPVEDGKAWIAEKGYKLGYQAYAMPAGSPNYAGLLSQAKSQGAEYIIIQNVASPAAQVAKDIKAGGMDMKIVCLNWCSNELFIKTAGADVAEGHMMIQPIAPLSTNKPGHKAINDYITKKGIKPEDVTVSWVAGWATMEAMAKGITKAGEGGDLTGPAIKEALETMGAIDVGQLIGGETIQFSTDSHRGTSSSGVYSVEGGKMVEVEAPAQP
ncbi:MAG: ABC transporter substrate-binding protein [Tetrasphaera sp.]